MSLDDASLVALLTTRCAARTAKDWATSDRIRDELRAAGYAVNDATGRWSLNERSGSLVGVEAADFFAAKAAAPAAASAAAAAAAAAAVLPPQPLEAAAVAAAAAPAAAAAVKNATYKPKRRDKRATKREMKRQRELARRMAIAAAHLGLDGGDGDAAKIDAATSGGSIGGVPAKAAAAPSIAATDPPTLALVRFIIFHDTI